MDALIAQANAQQAQQQQLDMIMKLYAGPAGIAYAVVSVASLVCFIMVVVKMFQNNQTALGIVCLVTGFCCGGIGLLIAFVFGWIKSSEWGIKNLMIVWTILFILGIGIGGYQGTVMVAEMQKLQQQLQNNPQLR